jgi:hypothetical protein
LKKSSDDAQEKLKDLKEKAAEPHAKPEDLHNAKK